ncbi:MAG: DEAD/DEAH box helicase family protein [Flavobacteriaceae bacterium]|nr:DEAD/DEAH box helicase family protein [Flavobacteriaceae bacterium]MCI5087524.1 DEAD/DEAH box helicase family protein [Flavobacteriaceae bacterium]
MRVPTERRYEEYIERELNSLLDDGLQFKSRIHQRDDEWYDKNLCVIGEEFIDFLKSTQKDTYDTLRKKYVENTDNNILKRLNKEIENKGLVHVLRKGFNDVHGGNIKPLYFQSNSTRNENYRKDKYLKNRFLLVRQLHYSPHNNNSIDIVIFINGIPILTVELKNQLTGQTVDNSDNQYRFDRNPKGEPLLQFDRCICHFSVDNDKVNMTTMLNGKDTFFLPFNKTLNNSETESDGFKVDYLWKEILTPTSILDIIENFVLVTKTSDFVWSDEKRKVVETKPKPVLIFPRYHQLEVIRKLKNQILKDGVGTNYLIQHTTGSGKSYSIGWLSFMLTNLFKNDGQDRVFDSIIIITDRKVLDKQLQDTVTSLQQVQGVVQQIDKNSEQLRKSLTSGKNIIVTTIQKFSVVVNRMKELNGKTFGVIVDEVHSSQGGKGTKNLNKTLSLNLEDEVGVTDDVINDEISKIQSEMKSRQKQNHISFFGFTGTPKPQTLEVFGTLQSDGTRRPFHTYTMRQSIGEGFTLDVLKSFTPVKRWFKLKGKGEDVELPESRGKKELIKWVDSNPETISRKCGIIIEHLLSTTIKSIEGRGKGMVIVRSIEDTVKFFVEMNKQLKDKGLHNKIKCVVGFSGEVQYNGEKVTEYSLNKENGFDSKDIPTGFKNPLYRVLIVCNKFQTGFDEPLLHSMFIDKPLNGVQCVQTLSRLNRKTRGKKSTFVLDFVNKVETIQESFQNFYQTTILSEDTDPNLVYDILDKIRNYGLFTPQEIDDWNIIFFSEKRDDSQLQPTLNLVLDRWKELPDEERDSSRTQFSNYCKLYGYISMVHQFDNIELEKHYVFFEYLRKKFPVDGLKRIDVSDLVDLDSLNLDIKGKLNISLENEDTIFDPNKYGDGRGKDEEEFDLLSELINEINEYYGNVPEGTEDSTKRLLQDIVNDDEFSSVVNSNNTESNKRDKLNQIISNKNIKTLDKSHELYEYFEKKEIKDKMIRMFISRPDLLNQLRL